MQLIKEIAKVVKEKGGRALLVGGYVRDQFLGLESKDYDLEVFNVKPDELISILRQFGKVDIVGESFGVLKLNNEIDVSMPRRERKTGKGYRGFTVSVDPYMSYKEACSRRDLTINAMMLDPLTNELIDPFNGFRDIKRRVLKHVNQDTFVEDPLRVLRVAQFKARFNFDVEASTSIMCKHLIPELKHLSKERIFVELEKILMKAEKPSIAFRWMYIWGILEELFPELHVLAEVEQGKKYHPEGSAFEHTMLSIDAVPMALRTITNMLAVLLHDTGKATCKSEVDENDPDHIHFKGHAECGASTARQFLDRVTNQTDIREQVITLVTFHMMPYQLKQHMKKRSVRRLAIKVDIPNLLLVHRADKNGRISTPDLGYVNDIAVLYNEIKDEIHPLMKGRHLIGHFKMKPGAHFGLILKTAFEAQLDGEFSTVEKGLEFLEGFLEGMDFAKI